ncbi:MarR family transcriptional regulator [Enterococcus hulanensis]|uniref:MarR family transcriptional regulator n=1 Tax=Enterococcus hulanensis TaxID=2559929 RepID=A0ABU3EU40_9ENTE|nr:MULTISPECIES: MarR family transcriptional regulator [Enterococcus]MBO0459508.1 MarR family transcriptional regulator [Enterococcus hulanensis]MBX8939106.1 MarR family transcriptional regulator [Enterococcus gilvus]MDT2598380.1 MarR family transcriptional regulator [Enterococcus hulanensis]MDT2608115.1 MarR family transcriptional regulator [Enterococcus hulanensis]MDT2615410.1 MarR family transcriptional regulator [Enterococcus hulanensis]
MENYTFKDRPDNQRIQLTIDHYAQESDSTIASLFLDFQWTYREMQKAYDAVLEEYGLSESKFIILMFLERAEEHSLMPSELAEKLGASRATITKLVNNMERDQLIRKIPSASDKRAVLVQMTDIGTEVLVEFLPKNFEATKTLLNQLSKEEIDQLFYLLNKIKQGTDELNKEREQLK